MIVDIALKNIDNIFRITERMGNKWEFSVR